MTSDTQPQVLSEDDFDALEELLISEVVPEDCMNLEMLDGYLAAVIASPDPIPMADWLPPVWSAHADPDYATGSRMQRVIRLVLGYYNELVTTTGVEEGWQPFCYAGQEGDEIGIAEEWVEGFRQGLELWEPDWRTRFDAQAVAEVEAKLAMLLAPWEGDEEAFDGDERRRMAWLDEACDLVADLHAVWSGLGLTRPGVVEVDAPRPSASAAVGRNDPCPCGSGKKYKKCCGAVA